MPSPTSRSALLAVAVLLAAAAILTVWLLREGDAPDGRSPTETTTTDPADERAAAGARVVDDAGALPAPTADDTRESGARSRVAASTVVSGRFTRPQPPWPGGGTAELVVHVDPPKGGMLGLFDMGMNAAKASEDERPEAPFAFLGRGPAVASAPVDGDGTFRVENAPPGRYRVRLTHPTLRALEEPVVDVAENGSEDVGEIGTEIASSLLVLVSDRDGRGIPGADVGLANEFDPMEFSDPNALVDAANVLGKVIPRERETDARGVARFDGLASGQRFVLSVRARDRVEHHRVVTLAPGRECVERVELSTGATMRVTVRHEDGRPAEGARLELRYPDLDKPSRATMGPVSIARTDATTRYSLTTDARGEAERTGLPAGRAELHVRTPGHRRTSQPVALEIDETTHAEAVLDPGVVVSGRVVDEHGASLQGAIVLHVPMIGESVMGMDLGSMMGADFFTIEAKERGVTCDEEGRFVLGGFEDGEVAQLVATAKGFDPKTREDVPAGATDVEIRLMPQCAVQGRVVDDRDGSPITAFTVGLRKRQFLVMERTLVSDSFASADGRFELAPCPRESADLVVEAPGFAVASESVDLDEGSLDVGEIRLLVPAAVEGTVVGPDGAPVAGATVREAKGGPFDSGLLAKMTGATTVDTDDRGRFRLENLSGRAVRLIAEAPALAPRKSDPIRIEPGVLVSDVLLQLGPGGRIDGRLVDENDDPLAGWRIQAAHVDGSSIATMDTDADGRFAFDGLGGGSYKVDAVRMEALDTTAIQPEDFDSGFDFGEVMSRVLDNTVSERVVVREGETSEVELVFEGAAGSDEGLCRVDGTVRVGNEPLAEGALLWMSPGASTPRQVMNVRDGRIRPASVRPGTWQVQVQSGIFTGAVGGLRTIEVPDAPSHQISIEMPGGRIEGRVVRDGDGEPVAACVVALGRPDDASGRIDRLDFGEGTALTDGDGRFAFAGLDPGDYDITAKQLLGGGLTGRLTPVTVGASQLVDGVEVRLEKGGTLRVAVRDSEGVRANALVTVLGNGGAPLGLFHRTLTDVDGTVTFSGLPEGRYRVSVDAPGAAPAISAPADVREGDTADLDVVLEKGAAVAVVASGEVRSDLGGEPITYSVWRGDGALLRAGRFVLPASGESVAPSSIGRLSPGAYRVRLESPRLGVVDGERRVPPEGDAVWQVELPR